MSPLWILVFLAFLIAFLWLILWLSEKEVVDALAPLLQKLSVAQLGATHGEYKYDSLDKTIYAGKEEIIVAERFQFDADGKFIATAANTATKVKELLGGQS